MKSAAPDLTELAQNLVRSTGRDPALYEVTVLDGGTVCVRGPGASAFYPPADWMNNFASHLYKGYYDVRLPHRSIDT
jgi:hypothetical protein